MKKILYGTLLLLCLLSIVNAEDDKSTLMNNAPVLATAEYKGVTFNIIKAEMIDTGTRTYSSFQVTQRKANGYVRILIEIKNGSQRTIKFDKFIICNHLLSLTDEKGVRYYALNTEEQPSKERLIYPEESELLRLFFEIPDPSSKLLTLSFDSRGFFQENNASVSKVNKEGIRIISLVNKEGIISLVFDRNKIVESKGEKIDSDIVDYDKECKIDDLVIKVMNVQLGRWSVRGDEFDEYEAMAELLAQYVTKRQPEESTEAASLKEKDAQKSNNSHMEVSQQTSDKKNKSKVSMIAISYECINASETKKMDLGSGLVFSLSDEFNNNYQLYHKPDDYIENSKLTQPKEFVSLYPKQVFGDTLFFEPPVDKATYLILTVNTSGVGIKKSLKIKIPKDLPISVKKIEN